MARQKNGRMVLRGIPGPILVVVAILWTLAAVGLFESGWDWVDYREAGDGNPFTTALLIGLIGADLVNAVLGFGIQLHRHWARSSAIVLSLVRGVAALIAVAAGDTTAVLLIAVYIVIVILLVLPSSAHWCDR